MWADGAQEPEFTGVNEDFEHCPTANGSCAVDFEQVLRNVNLITCISDLSFSLSTSLHFKVVKLAICIKLGLRQTKIPCNMERLFNARHLTQIVQIRAIEYGCFFDTYVRNC